MGVIPKAYETHLSSTLFHPKLAVILAANPSHDRPSRLRGGGWGPLPSEGGREREKLLELDSATRMCVECTYKIFWMPAATDLPSPVRFPIPPQSNADWKTEKADRSGRIMGEKIPNS